MFSIKITFSKSLKVDTIKNLPLSPYLSLESDVSYVVFEEELSGIFSEKVMITPDGTFFSATPIKSSFKKSIFAI